MIDFDLIQQTAISHLDSLLQEWFPEGRREGREFKVGSLNGERGRSLSINMNTGVWKDFSSDAGGAGPISLLATIRGIKNGEAAKILKEQLSIRDGDAVPVIRSENKDEWVPLPISISPPSNTDFIHHKYGHPTTLYPYVTSSGLLIGYVCRWDLADRKEILPFCQCEKSGSVAWKWKSFEKPRPIFGLDLLVQMPAAKVLVVEGEKCALAARELFKKACVISWAGGSKAIKYTDWTPLAERDVTIWPDNDKPGIDAATEIAEILSNAAASVRIVQLPEGKPDGWDIADSIKDGTEVSYLVELLRSAIEFNADIVQDNYNEEVFASIASEEEIERTEETPFEPFKILGHADGNYYYLRKSTQTIHVLTPGQHTKLELIAIAPANYWESNYPAKDGADWFAAANSLIQRASLIDFSSSSVRGRGAWLDDNRVVFHAGKCLYVDRSEVPLDGFASEYTYKKGQKLEADLVEALSSAEANKLVKLLECIQFRNKLDAKFFAGWLALAPICGALEWRPHIWLTGPSGSGKSWLLSHVVRPVLGNCAQYFQSVTTSAGIRQSLGCDALPVVFDEAEVEREADQKRMQEVIILARQASRETDGRIVKGTAHGNALSWHIRSCFLFASIGLGATQRADLSRITAIDLLPESQRTEDRFPEAQALQKETVRKKEWTSQFRARCVELAPIIAKNAEIFKDAVLDHLGNQRDADQYGSLLAGAYSLSSRKLVTMEIATKWCKENDWSAFISSDLEKDESKCLALLLEAIVYAQISEGVPARITVMELIQGVYDHDWNSQTARTYRAALERCGIAARKDGVDVANSHEELARIFKGSQFAGRWSEMLKRITGTRNLASTKILDLSKRAVRLPLSLFQFRGE